MSRLKLIGHARMDCELGIDHAPNFSANFSNSAMAQGVVGETAVGIFAVTGDAPAPVHGLDSVTRRPICPGHRAGITAPDW